MACTAEEITVPWGAITANQAVGNDLGAYKNAFSHRAHIEYVLIDNQSEATLTLLHPRQTILPGERKSIPFHGRQRDVLIQAGATVNAGELFVTMGICREGW